MNVWVIAGPTAAGKSAVALQVAAATGATIVAADAMQVYRGMDVGTAKPTAEERRRVPHRMLDVVDVDEGYSAALYQRDARAVVDALLRHGTPVLLVGGTGLYIRAVIDDLVFGPPPDPDRRRSLEQRPLDDLVAELRRLAPDRAATVDLANPRRVVRAIEAAHDGAPPPAVPTPRYDVRYCVLAPAERVRLYERIDARVGTMLAHGWLDEVAALGPPERWSRTARAAIGYGELAEVVAGTRDIDDAADAIRRRTRAYARRQLTWFRGERRADWFDADRFDVADAVLRYLSDGEAVCDSTS